MFLSSGTFIETVEARVKTLQRILKDYIDKKFTGYVIFRNDVRGIYVSIALIKGYLAACRSVDEGSVYEGIECCRTAMKYLNFPEGVVEVYDTPFETIELDMVLFPLSRVERENPLSITLGAKVGVPREEVTIPPPAFQIPTPPVTLTAPAPQPLPAEEVKPSTPVTPPKEEVVTQVAITKEMPKEEAVQPILQPTPPAPPPVTAEVVSAKPVEISLSGECIDPVTLYMVLKSGQLIETIQNPVSIEEIINKIKTIVKDRKPSYGYVSGYIENIVFRALYDSQSNNIYIEIEKEGTTVCGDNARKELGGKTISSLKIWIVS